jgi:hypothetical protein
MPAQATSRVLTPAQAAISVVKCSIGAGSFALPNAYANAGIFASIILTCIMAAVTAYSINLLLESEHFLNEVVARSRESTRNIDNSAVYNAVNAQEDDRSVINATATSARGIELITNSQLQANAAAGGDHDTSSFHVQTTVLSEHGPKESASIPELSRAIINLSTDSLTIGCVSRASFATLAYGVIQILVMCTAIGVSAAYFVFCAELIINLLGDHVQDARGIVWFLVPFEAVLCSLEDVRSLQTTTVSAMHDISCICLIGLQRCY